VGISVHKFVAGGLGRHARTRIHGQIHGHEDHCGLIRDHGDHTALLRNSPLQGSRRRRLRRRVNPSIRLTVRPDHDTARGPPGRARSRPAGRIPAVARRTPDEYRDCPAPSHWSHKHRGADK
jgi:hypothetical protein